VQSGRKPQDRDREDALRKLFELEPANQNRTGPDAVDENNRYYELKSTTRDRVSTARDVGPEHLRKWRQLNWIFGRGQYSGKTFEFESTYILTPTQMEPWFSLIESKITQDDALFARALNILEANGFTPAERDRIRRAFRRGVLLNDPKITWGYIQTHGVEIRREHARTLRQVLLSPN
jgi:Restriction endonuclease PvuII